jgi:hypothetical protein
MATKTRSRTFPDALLRDWESNDWNWLGLDVPDVTRQEVTVGARHRSLLEGSFHGQKAASKLSSEAKLPRFDNSQNIKMTNRSL